jgi:hypothetical protein
LRIEGFDEFGGPVYERIICQRNGSYRTRSYNSVDIITFDELHVDAYAELANDVVTVSLFGNVCDNEFIYLSDKNNPDYIARQPQWDISGNKLRLRYRAADTDEIYYAGYKDLETLNTYTLLNDTSLVTPEVFVVDHQRPYIYVLESTGALTGRLLVFSKFDEYPSQDMLLRANDATAFAQMDLMLYDHGTSTLTIEPRYLRHRTGSKITQYKLWYENTAGDTFAYSGEHFAPGDPFYTRYDIRGDDI